MRKEFFNVVSVEDFFARFTDFERIAETEELGLFDAYQRVLAEDVFSPEDLPPFARATMDGYAVRAKDTFGASEFNPVYLKKVGVVEIGRMPDFEIDAEECSEIVTGAPLPKGADSVVMVEYTDVLGDEIEVKRSVAPGENVILKAEDCAKGEILIKKGTRLRPQDIGILAAVGIPYVKVFKKPKVGIISTGDELVEITKTPELGKIRDVNTYTLWSLCLKSYTDPVTYGIVRDHTSELKEAISKALNECDVVLISGGSSIGVRDLTIEAIESLKGKILIHGISISPGKPTILAKIDKRPVIGLPGQVASAQIVMFVLVVPFLRYLSGERAIFDKPSCYVEATMSRNVASKQGREDYIRVKLKRKEESWTAEPILGKSGLLKTLLEADGLVKIPSEKEGVYKDEKVKVFLF